MTQHQAPEVTSELLGCPWCALPFQGHFKVPGGAVFLYTVPGKHGPNCPMRLDYFDSEEAAEAAWNTRATQPLSLTVDEEAVDRAARAISLADANHDYDALGKSNKDHYRRMARAALGSNCFQNGNGSPAAGEQIAENANCSGDVESDKVGG